MIHTARRSLLVFVVLSFFAVAVAHAQEKTVKKAPVENVAANSGEKMFASYCAPCHGKDAKGSGPAAADLKTTPPDLTTLAKRHDGKYPSDYVANVLRNGVKAPAHGSAEMPTWGPVFAAVSNRDEAIVTMRISNLVSYIKSLQEK